MRIGIVGAGSMAAAHTPAWKAAQPFGARLTGILSNQPGTAETFATQHGLKVYPTYEDLLADVDIVDLCIPTNLHAEFAIQAARAGKHIFCEKPIALNLDDARAMIDACNRANVRLFIGHVLRFVPQYTATQQVIAAGRIGQIGVMRLTRAAYQPRKAIDNWFVDESRSGGMILDLMIHDYDYARWIGGDVVRVFAKSIRAARPDAPVDYALVSLRFASGAIGHVEGGWAYPPGHFRTSIDIAGTDGLIEWTSDTADPLHVHLAKTEAEQAADVGLPVSILGESPFAAEIRHFYESVVNNTPFIVTPEDGLRALEIGLAARESLKTGRSVTIGGERS
jgi:predicted dehydrogenase